jgi:hypothetical protein
MQTQSPYDPLGRAGFVLFVLVNMAGAWLIPSPHAQIGCIANIVGVVALALVSPRVRPN